MGMSNYHRAKEDEVLRGIFKNEVFFSFLPHYDPRLIGPLPLPRPPAPSNDALHLLHSYTFHTPNDTDLDLFEPNDGNLDESLVGSPPDEFTHSVPPHEMVDPLVPDDLLDLVLNDDTLDSVCIGEKLDRVSRGEPPTGVTTNEIPEHLPCELPPHMCASSSSSLSSSKQQPRYAHGLGSLQFPNGMSPVVARMCIYAGNSLADAR